MQSRPCRGHASLGYQDWCFVLRRRASGSLSAFVGVRAQCVLPTAQAACFDGLVGWLVGWLVVRSGGWMLPVGLCSFDLCVIPHAM